MQWASGNLLNNPDLGFDEGVYIAYESLDDIGMSFINRPEIKFYDCNCSITNDTASMIFAQNLTGGLDK